MTLQEGDMSLDHLLLLQRLGAVVDLEFDQWQSRPAVTLDPCMRAAIDCRRAQLDIEPAL